MPEELLFTVEAGRAGAATPISLADAGLRERADLQEWVLANPHILGSALKIVTFEFDRWSSAAGSRQLDRLDVLALGEDGRIVVAELKRDRAPDTVEMQAIKYAAMASRFTPETLAEEHARFLTARGETTPNIAAMEALTSHAPEMSAETLRRPRIVIVAADFPPVVTATTVWLTEMGLDITLVQFQAYRTEREVVLTVSQLYPVRDVEDFTVSPERSERRAAEATRRRVQETSAVKRLVEAEAIPDGTAFTLKPGFGVAADANEKILAWVEENNSRGRATWRNDSAAPLIWEADQQSYSPSDLSKMIVREVTSIERSLQGTKWWIDEEGRDLVELAAELAGSKGDLFEAFWASFLERVREEHPDWTSASARTRDSWITMPSGLSGTRFIVSFAVAGGFRLRAELYVGSTDPEANTRLFDQLSAQKKEIEAGFGEELSWDPLPGRKACRIATHYPGRIEEHERWSEYADWFVDAISRLKVAFAGRSGSGE